MTICKLCEKTVSENSGRFIIGYVDEGTRSTFPVIEFCIECFISLAGHGWAAKCGYKSSKSQIIRDPLNDKHANEIGKIFQGNKIK